MPPPSSRLDPPQSERELLERARALGGMSLGRLASLLRRELPRDPVRGKGLPGELAERYLGATAGNVDVPDFPHLGIELKTIPLDAEGRVHESTFVCALDLKMVDREEWERSRVRRKLARVLWLPVSWSPGAPPATRRFGSPLLWSLGSEEESLLRGDWMELVGTIALGGIDEITAHMGQVLQIRPKAANAAARIEARGPDGERLPTVPRGFYLRARFTERILWACSSPVISSG